MTTTGRVRFRSFRNNKMTAKAKIFWWPELRRDNEPGVKNYTACLATGKNPGYQIPQKIGNLRTITEPEQKQQIDFIRNLHNQ